MNPKITDKIFRLTGLDTIRDDYNKAKIRVYGDNRQLPEFRLRGVMEWLLKFTQTELNSLSSADWNNLRYDIAAFTAFGSCIDDEYSKVDQDKITSFNYWPYSDIPIEEASSIDGIAPSKKTVVNLQETSFNHVKNLLRNGRTDFSISHIQVAVSKIHLQIKTDNPDCKEDPLNIYIKSHKFDKVEKNNSEYVYTEYLKDTGLKLITAESPITVFEYHLASMLTKYALRITDCPECKTIYLSNRKDQKFCTTRCQSRNTMRKIRNTPPERMNKRGRPKKENNGGVNHGKEKLKG